MVKTLWRSDEDNVITFKAIEKYRYGVGKTVSKHFDSTKLTYEVVELLCYCLVSSLSSF